MRHAPAVSYPVGRSFFLACLLGVLLLAIAALQLCWVVWQPAAAGWAVAMTAASLVPACWLLRGAPRGTLHWDGGQWHWRQAGVESMGCVQVRLDWQRGMLLEWRPRQGRRQWLWLESRAAAWQWDALRRAVHAPAGEAA